MTARLRGFVLIATLVVGIDWGGWGLAQHYLPNTIYNPAPPQLAILTALAFGYLFLVFVFRSRLGLIGCALVFGGSAGNILGHVAFGPVADYIPEPFRNGSWECNPADLAIWTGSVMLVIALGFYLRDHYRYERVRGFRSSTARRESSSTSGRKRPKSTKEHRD